MEHAYHRQAPPQPPPPTTSSKPTRSQTAPEDTTTQPTRSSHARNLSRKLHAHSIRSHAHAHAHSKDKDAHKPSSSSSTNHKPHRSVRHAAKDTVQSAIDIKLPASFDALLRRNGADKRHPSPGSSRRASASANPQLQQDWDFAAQQAEAERRAVKPADVERLRGENERRERELRAALGRVEALGMRSTRMLDDAYYAILERAEGMRNTLAEMQRLAAEVGRAREGFDSGVQGLEGEVGERLRGFGEFGEQEGLIEGFVGRLAGAKERTEGLNGRLEGARRRVEEYERRYRGGQAKRRKQWRITWGTLGAVVVLVVALLVARNHRHIGYRLNGYGRMVVVVGDVVEEAVSPVTERLKPSPSEDPVLREMFEGVS